MNRTLHVVVNPPENLGTEVDLAAIRDKAVIGHENIYRGEEDSPRVNEFRQGVRVL